MARDWRQWHDEYGTTGSRLQLRLEVVRGLIADALDRMPPGPIRVISACAGDGRDLLGVLAEHPRAGDVRARLVELDAVLAVRAADNVPEGVDVEVVCGDASTTSAYAGAVPAELVLVCGVFGNISDDDIERTVQMMPALCAAGGTVVWTRHRRPPDRTVEIRRWFAKAGFEEVAFAGHDDFLFGVGAHRLVGATRPYVPDERMFTFVGYDSLT
jgi:hypothetical protein